MMFKMFNKLFKNVHDHKMIFENTLAKVLLEASDDIGCEAQIGDTFTVDMKAFYEGSDYILFVSENKKPDLLISCQTLKTVYDEAMEKCRYYLGSPCGNYVFRYVGCEN